jgi:hypothetical protein
MDSGLLIVPTSPSVMILASPRIPPRNAFPYHFLTVAVIQTASCLKKLASHFQSCCQRVAANSPYITFPSCCFPSLRMRCNHNGLYLESMLPSSPRLPVLSALDRPMFILSHPCHDIILLCPGHLIETGMISRSCSVVPNVCFHLFFPPHCFHQGFYNRVVHQAYLPRMISWFSLARGPCLLRFT